MLEADRVADTHLHQQLSQDEEDEDSASASDLSEAGEEQQEVEAEEGEDEGESGQGEAGASYAEPGSQHQPIPISVDSDSNFQSNSGPRCSGRVKKPSRVVESQQWQIDHGLIPAPGAKGRVRALNTKKKKNTEISQLENEFELLE
jgi:hypothetical protein